MRSEVPRAYRSLALQRGSYQFSCPELVVNVGLTVLLGLNGAGKTTLLEIMAGKLRPDPGAVGVDPSRVELLPQAAAINWPGTIGSLLRYLAAARGIPKPERTARVNAVSSQCQLPSAATTFNSLSGGWKRRVLVAQTLLREDRIVALDEPTDSLDVAASRQTWQVLREVSRSAPLVVATHNATAGLEFADRVVAITNGTVGAPIDGETLRTEATDSGLAPDAFLLEKLDPASLDT